MQENKENYGYTFSFSKY